jgi:hypothetical protein
MLFTSLSSLFAAGLPKVCLNVDLANIAAVRTYVKVGFIGLDSGLPNPLIEEWVEIGFENVELGQWT